MPLIPPALDDRSYDDLVQEMLANIPAHTPEWTNPQPGDPGRTLVELFAWLADTILYRANLIPERQRIAFLQLLGQPMRPATAATGILSLTLDPSAVTPVGIVAAAKVTGAVPFETLGEIDLLPLTSQAYVKVPLSGDQLTQSMPLLTGLQKLYGMSTLPGGYTTTAVFPNGTSSTDGIDVINGTADQSLWLALLVANPANLAAVQKAIGGQYGQQMLNVGFVPSIAVPGLFSEVGPAAAVEASWQMTLPAPAAGQSQPTTFTNLKVMSDTTEGLTQTGVIQLLVPPADLIGAPSNDVRKDPQAGVGSKPPRIDDPAIAARLLAWVWVSASSSLKVSWMGVNAVEIDQRTTFSSIVIGVSDGSANQQFALPQPQPGQVDPDTFLLEVDMPGLGFQLWQQVDDLAVLQGPTPSYVLDPEACTVTFGNQLQGMIVPSGRRIRVQTMRLGGGAAGNLPAGSLTTIQAFTATGVQVPQKITVTQPIDTTGGADSETFSAAQQRIPSLLHNQGRAVTAADYSNLAQQVPGANVARVEVLPLFMPQTMATGVPGVVSVMILPNKDGVLNPCPRADRPTLETVYRYLSPRTPVAAEMYVIASEYVGLSIAVAVEVKTGYGLLQVSHAVETALRTYLWPISPGGLDGTGWPLGRRVRSLELDVIVGQVPGVIEVNGLNLFTPLAAGGYQLISPDTAGNAEIDLESWQLPEVLEVMVTAGPDGSGVTVATSLSASTGTSSTQPAVAVPIVPTVC